MPTSASASNFYGVTANTPETYRSAKTIVQNIPRMSAALFQLSKITYPMNGTWRKFSAR
jgi:hypothetical protein